METNTQQAREEIKRPVTQRIRTFEDAARETGIKDPEEWLENYEDLEPDILAYFKLRIICKALNEGWEPKFTKTERRYYPWFWLDDKKTVEEQGRNFNAIPTDSYQTEYEVFAYSHVHSLNWSFPPKSHKLCLKSEELAKYCGQQFTEIWADFCLPLKE